MFDTLSTTCENRGWLSGNVAGPSSSKAWDHLGWSWRAEWRHKPGMVSPGMSFRAVPGVMSSSYHGRGSPAFCRGGAKEHIGSMEDPEMRTAESTGR